MPTRRQLDHTRAAAEAIGQIARRFEAGEEIRRLARQRGVNPNTLSRLLHRRLGDRRCAEIVGRTHARLARENPLSPDATCTGVRRSVESRRRRGILTGLYLRRYCCIGAVKVRRQPGRRRGRRWIKIGDEGPHTVRWIPYARHLWQQTHGPIPPGWVVVHLDGDTLHDTPSNLLAIPKRSMPAYCRALRPGLDERRIAAVRAWFAKPRHRTKPINSRVAMARKRTIDPRRTIRQCPGCGAARNDKLDRCPRCGAERIETIEQRIA